MQPLDPSVVFVLTAIPAAILGAFLANHWWSGLINATLLFPCFRLGLNLIDLTTFDIYGEEELPQLLGTLMVVWLFTLGAYRMWRSHRERERM